MRVLESHESGFACLGGHATRPACRAELTTLGEGVGHSVIKPNTPAAAAVAGAYGAPRQAEAFA